MRTVVRGRKTVLGIILAACLFAGIFALVSYLKFPGRSQRLPPGAQAPPSSPPAPQDSPQSPESQAPPESSTVPVPPKSSLAPAPCPTDYGWGSFDSEGFGPNVYSPVYAPSGCEIAFIGVGDDGREGGIWVVTADGRHLWQVPTDVRLDSFFSKLSWSPNGSRIAFASSAGDIWVVRPDGSHPMQLTVDPAKDLMPAWSPDGTRMAFVSDRSGSREIWIMNPDGTAPRMVTSLLQKRGASDPAFSPDGRQLVFAQSESVKTSSGRHSHLAIINVDGTALRQLTAGDVRDERPHWSTYGIVFESDRTGIPNAHYDALWIIQPDGSGLRALPDAGGERPAWSSDGTKIVFSGGYGGDIHVLNFLDGTIQPVVLPRVFPIVIHIRPGSTNTINPRTERKVAVAILSTPWLDPVRQINRASITFGPTGNERSPVSCVEQEVNQDEVTDLVCQFDVVGFLPRHTEGILRAIDVKGIRFEGRDEVKVLP